MQRRRHGSAWPWATEPGVPAAARLRHGGSPRGERRRKRARLTTALDIRLCETCGMADGDHQRTGSAVRGLLTQDDLAGLGVADGRVRWRCRSAPGAEDRPEDDQREPEDQTEGDRLVEDQGAEQDGDGRVHVGDQGHPGRTRFGDQGEHDEERAGGAEDGEDDHGDERGRLRPTPARTA